MLDVLFQLHNQRVDAIELALAAQKVGESNPCSLAVEIVREIEQVSFKERVISVLVEGRAPAQIESARMGNTVGAFVPAGIHAISRHTNLVGDLDVGRWKTELSPALVAAHNRPAHLEGVAEHVVGKFDLSASERTTDSGRTNRLVDAVRAGNKFTRVHVEVVQGTEFAK